MKRAFVAVALLFVAANVAAQTWRIESAKSKIEFSLRHMMVSKAKGQFGAFSGTVTGNPNDPTNARIDINIDPSSINTGNAERDADLRSANFFEVAKYPTVTFRSKRIARAGAGLTVTGDLTMHGVTKEVKLDVESFTVTAPNRVHALAKTKINRKDFGITWNKALDGGGVTLGDDVNLTITAQFVRE